jgi:hypothetical protein
MSLEEEEEVENTTDNQQNSVVDQSEQLQKEVKNLKTDKKVQSIETGCKGVIFIRIKDSRISPVEITKRIMLKFVEDQRTINTRFIFRMIPVQTTVHGTKENIITAAQGKVANALINIHRNCSKIL